jgi:hypothetical protein
MRTCCNGKWPMRLATPFVFVAAMLAMPAIGAAQDGFTFGADNQGAPIARPGFGVAGQAAVRDRPELGAAGLGDYSFFLGPHFSIVEPTEDIDGLLSVFRVTQLLCNSLYQGDKSLVEAAPKGFVIARGDIHALGFGGNHWDGDWYAVTVTGDSETDAAGGHPAWEIRYDNDGSLISCGVAIGTETRREQRTIVDADRTNVIQYMYIGMPQLFSAIITEPRFAGLYPLSPSELITMAVPCGGVWCRIVTVYDFSPGMWYVSSTIRFNLPQKAD